MAAEPPDHSPAEHAPGLNPHLAQTRYCSRCAAPATVDFPRRVSCDACGFIAYFNPKPVAAAIPLRRSDGHVWLLRRGFDPGGGLWTFPGGFVDLGESTEDAAHRETREEVDIAIELTGLVGVYSRPQDRVVLVVYSATTDETPRTTPEATEVRAFAPADVPWDDLAFWSTEAALRDLLGRPPGPTDGR
jgi:ADP-ribose pyrophosphatase YjhB (NUDIX family)